MAPISVSPYTSAQMCNWWSFRCSSFLC